jgi:hypothetical protein
MLSGRWSASGDGLAPATVNARINEALLFLYWARDRGLRGEILVPSGSRKIRADTYSNAYGHRPLLVKAKSGGVRMSPFELRLPRALEVARWLKDVEVRYGPAKALMCRMVLDTALRRREIVEFRCVDLGTPDSWNTIRDLEIQAAQLREQATLGKVVRLRGEQSAGSAASDSQIATRFRRARAGRWVFSKTCGRVAVDPRGRRLGSDGFPESRAIIASDGHRPNARSDSLGNQSCS